MSKDFKPDTYTYRDLKHGDFAVKINHKEACKIEISASGAKSF
jgi:hypothetical protein